MAAGKTLQIFCPNFTSVNRVTVIVNDGRLTYHGLLKSGWHYLGGGALTHHVNCLILNLSGKMKFGHFRP